MSIYFLVHLWSTSLTLNRFVQLVHCMLLYLEEYSYVIKKSTSDTKKKTQLAFASKVAKSKDASSARKAVEKHVPYSREASTSSVTFVGDSGKQNESGLIAYVHTLSHIIIKPTLLKPFCIPKTSAPYWSIVQIVIPLKIQRFTTSSDGKKLNQ